MDFFVAQVCVPLAMTLIGAIIGSYIGIYLARRDSTAKFKKERDDILKALHNSIDNTLGHIEQIENLHFGSDQIPSFPLDTVAMSYITLTARKYLPEGTDWAQHYNGMRFELDHINRKLLLYHIRPTEDQLKGIKKLIENIKPILEKERDALRLKT